MAKRERYKILFHGTTERQCQDLNQTCLPFVVDIFYPLLSFIVLTIIVECRAISARNSGMFDLGLDNAFPLCHLKRFYTALALPFLMRSSAMSLRIL